MTANRRTISAWALYDFGSSAFTTLVVTFVYATYFAQGIAPNETVGTEWWSNAVTATAIIVAVVSPYVGALADRGHARKAFLGITTVVCVGATALLVVPQAGDVWWALGLFVVANIAFELSYVFYNAFLPEIAPSDQMGRVSGLGWGLGYIGGLGCLVVALVGFVMPETPWFGLSTANSLNVRATNGLVAGWYALFALPLFWLVPEPRAASAPAPGRLFQSTNRQLRATFRALRTEHRGAFRLLVARLFYNDGLITIFAFGGLYAGVTFGFSTQDVIFFGIALNVAAGLGALLFGYVDDWIGGKATIFISIGGLAVATLMAALTTSVTVFWAAGILIGLMAGPNQSASRSLLGRFVPPSKENEFYGLFAFSGKAASFLGPLLFGQLTAAFGTQRAGVAAVLVFFLIGGVLLATVPSPSSTDA
ncbi:MFS transporter [Salisaeta longa]|uniref:MFS transporter n=1 Tax=Salisaeta longa TaxID=503170 RepID=UPI0003B38117|nr:MFS transporter [Salisaeta longa]